MVAGLGAVAVFTGVCAAVSGLSAGSASALPAGSTSVIEPGKAAVVGQLAGQATPGVPLLNDTTGTVNFDAGDLGIMWDDGDGHTMVAYGDSYGAGFQPAPGGGPASNDDHLCNTLARSGTSASSLSRTMSLSFVTGSSGSAQNMIPCATDSSAASIIPTGGISVNGKNYLDVMAVQDWGSTAGVWQTSYAELAESGDDGQTWTVQPTARWLNNSSCTDDFQQAALASHHGYVYLFGTPNGRFGNAYLARVPDAGIAAAADYTYWTGTGWQAGAGTAAIPVVSGPVAELSVQYNAGLRLWLMTYLDTPRNAIVLRYAQSPQGPWSGQQVIVQPSDMPAGTSGIYGGFMHPWSTATDLYLTVSSWYPYQVYLVHVPLAVGSGALNLVSDGTFSDPMDGYSGTVAPASAFGWSSDGPAGVDVGLGNGNGTPDEGWTRNDNDVFNDLYQTISVVPDQDYSFSVWIRTSSTNVAAYAGVRNVAGTAFWQAGPIGSLSAYTEYTVQFNSGNNPQVQVFAGTWPQSGVDTWIQVDQFDLTSLHPR